MSLGTGLYSTGGGYSAFGNDFGFESYDLFTPTTTVLESAKATATAKGDKNWQKVLDGVLKYGGSLLTILTTAGVIKNKNLTTVANGEYDQNALAALLAANGGSIDKSPEAITVPKSSGFAIDFSNPVILLLIVAVGYILLKK